MIALAAAALVAATPIRLDEVRAAARQNLEALQAELEARRAGAQVDVARSFIYPRLSLEANASAFGTGPQRSFQPVTDPTTGSVSLRAVDVPPAYRGNFSLALTVSQLLYDGGRWWTRIAQSGAESEAAAGRSEEQRLASELEAVRRFYELLRSERAQEVLEATVRQSTQHVARAQALFEAGRVDAREVVSAEVNLGNDRIAAVQQRQRIAASQADLALWIARPGAEALTAIAPEALSAPLPAPPRFEEAVVQARRQRPLLRALSERVRASELAERVAAAPYLPQISASASYLRQSPTADPFFTDPTRQNGYSAGLNFRWELFSGFQTNAEVEQARLFRRGAELDLEQANRALEGDLRRSLTALEGQVEVARLAEENRERARRGLSLAEERFQAGEGSTLDVRDAQLKLTQADLQVVQSRIDVEIARAALERVIGGSSSGEQR